MDRSTSISDTTLKNKQKRIAYGNLNLILPVTTTDHLRYFL